MLGLLALLFMAAVAELYVIVQVAGSIGSPETILLLIAVSVLGVGLARRVGGGVLRRMQATVAEGRVPSAEIVDGALVLLAGVLLVLPGFISDCLAILLLLPPVRAVVRGGIVRRIRAGGTFVRVIATPGRRDATSHDVWDVDGWEEPGPSDRPSLGP